MQKYEIKTAYLKKKVTGDYERYFRTYELSRDYQTKETDEKIYSYQQDTQYISQNRLHFRGLCKLRLQIGLNIDWYMD